MIKSMNIKGSNPEIIFENIITIINKSFYKCQAQVVSELCKFLSKEVFYEYESNNNISILYSLLKNSGLYKFSLLINDGIKYIYEIFKENKSRNVVVDEEKSIYNFLCINNIYIYRNLHFKYPLFSKINVFISKSNNQSIYQYDFHLNF